MLNQINQMQNDIALPIMIFFFGLFVAIHGAIGIYRGSIQVILGRRSRRTLATFTGKLGDIASIFCFAAGFVSMGSAIAVFFNLIAWEMSVVVGIVSILSFQLFAFFANLFQ